MLSKSHQFKLLEFWRWSPFKKWFVTQKKAENYRWTSELQILVSHIATKFKAVGESEELEMGGISGHFLPDDLVIPFMKHGAQH